jgi:hypothetical protein
VNFHREHRSNTTHQSTTDPEALLAGKGEGKEAKLCYSANALVENCNSLLIDFQVEPADWERFSTATRSIGPGLSYHVGAVAGSIMPVLIGAMQDRGAALPKVMTIAIATSLILCVVLIWLAPETRGRNFNET